MRLSASLCLALLLLAPLSGCLGGGTATAKDLVPQARSLAKEWNADAVLVGVATVEVGELPQFVRDAIAKEAKQGNGGDTDGADPEAQLLQYHDANVGDGRAPAWLFGFRSGGHELLLALDAAGHEALRHEDSGSPAGSTAPSPEASIGDFAIDSDQATRLAADANGTFAHLRGNAMVASLGLMPGPKGPIWMMVLAAAFGNFGGSGAGNVAVAAVDATTGNVTTGDDVDNLFGGASNTQDTSSGAFTSPYYQPRNRTFVQTETGSARATLSLAAPDQEQHFQVTETGHAKLRFQLDLPRSLPPTQATATVTGPDGRTATATFQAAATGSTPATAEIPTPVAGDYKVAFHLATGALNEADFSWCAPGSRMAAQDAGSACGQP